MSRRHAHRRQMFGVRCVYGIVGACTSPVGVSNTAELRCKSLTGATETFATLKYYVQTLGGSVVDRDSVVGTTLREHHTVMYCARVEPNRDSLVGMGVGKNDLIGLTKARGPLTLEETPAERPSMEVSSKVGEELVRTMERRTNLTIFSCMILGSINLLSCFIDDGNCFERAIFSHACFPPDPIEFVEYGPPARMQLKCYLLRCGLVRSGVGGVLLPINDDGYQLVLPKWLTDTIHVH